MHVPVIGCISLSSLCARGRFALQLYTMQYLCCFLFSQQKVCIKGAAQIEVLVGSLYIFGSILRPGHEPVNIFSTSISSLIAFSESSNHDTICTEDYFGTLQNALQNQPNNVVKMALLNRKRASSVLLVKSLQTVEMNFVCSFQKFQGIFNLNHQKVKFTFSSKNNYVYSKVFE